MLVTHRMYLVKVSLGSLAQYLLIKAIEFERVTLGAPSSFKG